MTKTRSTIEASAPANVRPSSVSKPKGSDFFRKMDFGIRRKNRQMHTARLLEVLPTQSPRFWEVAEVVGKWVWIEFAGKQPREVTFGLSQLGFHWNYSRQVWQHPCGTIADERADYDPRKRYGSYFPADIKPA